MGGDGRDSAGQGGGRSAEHADAGGAATVHRPSAGSGASPASVMPAELSGPPGGALAAAVHAAADPIRGLWPVGVLPQGASSAPWAQVVTTVAAARRVEGWALWAQLSMVARLLVAWRIAPPVSNRVGVEDRCGSDGPADDALAGRLHDEGMSAQERARGWWEGQPELLAEVFAGTEIALACGLTNYAADRRVEVAEAVFVQDRLPRLRRLLRAGWVDWYKLDTFVRETCHLDPVIVRAVERMVLGDLPVEDDVNVVVVLADPEQPGRDVPAFTRTTVPQLRAAIAAAVAAIDAEAAERRARTARTKRSVRCEAAADGTAILTAELAVEAAAAVWESLTAAARRAKAAGDPRSLDQLRADALLARTTGTPLPDPDPTPRPPEQ